VNYFELPTLCREYGCRLLKDHKSSKHDPYPMVWNFMNSKDKDKLAKAGFATPRGGAKAGYQNHVVRNSQVIIPYEKINIVSLNHYQDSYVIRLYPEQYFEAPNIPKHKFVDGEDSWIKVGVNAYILYRTNQAYQNFTPLADWKLRGLEKNGVPVNKRGKGVKDVGHYILRMPALSPYSARSEGAPQGVFAPEYADAETNYLCKCVLAWLIIHTVESPYTTTLASHLKVILAQEGLLDETTYENKGVLRHGLCSCPLCLKFINYKELHQMTNFELGSGSENAAEQIEGATRSTLVNLFHLLPLKYDSIIHIPQNIAWGHHDCNTKLGQRHCRSLAELQELDWKVGIIKPDGIETFGWISRDYLMIRSPLGAVWIQIVGDYGSSTETEDLKAEITNDSP